MIAEELRFCTTGEGREHGTCGISSLADYRITRKLRAELETELGGFSGG